MAITISRKYFRKKQHFRLDEDDEDGEKEEGAVDDEQAEHTAHVAGMIYARGIMEMDGVVASKREKFREASESWHRFLRFPHAMTQVHMAHPTRVRALFEDEAEASRVARRIRLRRCPIGDRLRAMMGKGASFAGSRRPQFRPSWPGRVRWWG
ncbi:MAG: hypothetical protein MMC33_010607 [Icmadophila ericetorum]|nr:hypothetical protein [Icmadophila ericetorum]